MTAKSLNPFPSSNAKKVLSQKRESLRKLSTT